jgi:hypothetical protein
MTCQEAIAVLADYLESVLDPPAVTRLEGHLADCQPCQAYLNTYRRTQEVAAAVNRVELPEEMRSRLRDFLMAQLRGSRG